MIKKNDDKTLLEGVLVMTMKTMAMMMMMMMTMMTTIVMIMVMMMNVKRARLVHFLVWRNPRQERIRDKSA